MKLVRFFPLRLAATLAVAFAFGFSTGAFEEESPVPSSGARAAVDAAGMLPPDVAMATPEPETRPESAAAPELFGTSSSEGGAAPTETAPSPAATSQQDLAAARRRDVARDIDPDAPRIVVSIDERRLWYIVGRDTVLDAPVAVGMNKSFEFEGRRFHFRTPRGTRRVLDKVEDPIWTVPVWHYYERAKWEDLEVVFLEADSRVTLSDGTMLVVIGDQVGRINRFGNFWPFTPGNEIIFDGKVFVPPMHTQQRRVPNALGPYKLDTGDGYLIHGTHIYNEESVGNAVSHGCVRMSNDDLERLYWMVEEGTPVIIR